MAKPKTPTTHFKTVPVKDVLRRLGDDLKPLEESPDREESPDIEERPDKLQKSREKDAPYSVRLAGGVD